MWFYTERKDVWGNPVVGEIYYVNGAFITGVNLFLISGVVGTIGASILGAAAWICNHILTVMLIYTAVTVVMLILQNRLCRKRNMLMYGISTVLTLVMFAVCVSVYTLPMAVLYDPINAALSLIFSALIFGGGAFLTINLNRMFDSGITCFVVSLIYSVLALLILHGFASIEKIEVSELMSVYKL